MASKAQVLPAHETLLPNWAVRTCQETRNLTPSPSPHLLVLVSLSQLKSTLFDSGTSLAQFYPRTVQNELRGSFCYRRVFLFSQLWFSYVWVPVRPAGLCLEQKLLPAQSWTFAPLHGRRASTGRTCAQGCKGTGIRQAGFAANRRGRSRRGVYGDCSKTNGTGRSLNRASGEHRRGNHELQLSKGDSGKSQRRES